MEHGTAHQPQTPWSLALAAIQSFGLLPQRPVCRICGTHYTPHPQAARTAYCSDDCRWEAGRSKKRVGKAFQGGINAIGD